MKNPGIWERQLLLEGRAAVEVCGPADAHPILFVGGWGQGVDQYRERLNDLAATFRVHAIGLPGFGDAPGLPVKLSTVEGMAALLDEAWGELGLGSTDAPVTLMGHSTGAAVAALLAAARPDLVSEVVLVLPAGSPDPLHRAIPRVVEHVRKYPLGSGSAGLALNFRSVEIVGNARLALSAKAFDLVPTLEEVVTAGVPVHLVVALDDLITPPGSLLHVAGTVVHHVHGGHGWFHREAVMAAALLKGILAEHVPVPAVPERKSRWAGLRARLQSRWRSWLQ